MLRFLSKLARKFQTANTMRSTRRTPRRTILQVEGLENRMALSTASLTSSTAHMIVEQPSQQVTSTVVQSYDTNQTTTTTTTTTTTPTTPTTGAGAGQIHFNEFTIKK